MVRYKQNSLLRCGTITIKTFIIFVLLLSGCSDNEAQQDFEDQAFNSPVESITETTIEGEVVEEDPDDWRISPFFSGLISVEPAFPNPVNNNTEFTVQIQISTIESMNGLNILAFDEERNLKTMAIDTRIPLPPGLLEIDVDPIRFTNTGVRTNARGLHRIFIFDLNDNLLTYGDIMVE